MKPVGKRRWSSNTAKWPEEVRKESTLNKKSEGRAEHSTVCTRSSAWAAEVRGCLGSWAKDPAGQQSEAKSQEASPDPQITNNPPKDPTHQQDSREGTLNIGKDTDIKSACLLATLNARELNIPTVTEIIVTDKQQGQTICYLQGIDFKNKDRLGW